MIATNKHPRVHPVGLRETWIFLFSKSVMRLTVPESTSPCHDDHTFAGLKAVINGTVHRVQAIWDTKLTMEDCGFLLVNEKTLITISIKSE